MMDQYSAIVYSAFWLKYTRKKIHYQLLIDNTDSELRERYIKKLSNLMDEIRSLKLMGLDLEI